MPSSLTGLTLDDIQQAAKEQFGDVAPVKLMPDENAHFMTEFAKYKVGTAERYVQEEMVSHYKYGSKRYREAEQLLRVAARNALQAEINMKFLVKRDKLDLLIDFMDLLNKIEFEIAFKNRKVTKSSLLSEDEGNDEDREILRLEIEEHDLAIENCNQDILTLLGYLPEEEKIEL